MTASDNSPSFLSKCFTHFRARVATGLLFFIPLAFTYLILRLIWNFLYDSLLPVFDLAESGVVYPAGIYLQITIVGILVVSLYVLGWVAHTVVGAQAITYWHGFIEKIPLVRGVYRVIHQITDMFSENPLTGKPVVVLEFPRHGILSLGVVTSQFIMPDGEEYLTVYVPTIPIPTSGYMALVKEDQVTHTELAFEEATRIILSGGVLSEEITKAHYMRYRGS
tara:strand:+ start:234 stop:899 length:666 start_codon:yes stop_codon:yes gene_type:complete